MFPSTRSNEFGGGGGGGGRRGSHGAVAIALASNHMTVESAAGGIIGDRN